MRSRWGGNRRGRLALAVLRLLFLGITGITFAIASTESSVPAQSPPALSTDAIVQKLMAANARRAERLRAYRSQRIYKLDYHGLFGGHAEMRVEATYRAPNEKDFRIVSESGSRLLLHQVLLKLLQSERDAQEEKNRKLLEITPANYEFHLDGVEHTPAGDFYVLDVKPRSKSKFVYRGKIWVDANDFAVARMDGSPATNPSIWVSHVEIQYQWAKIDGFWLPTQNHSVTSVRLGGRAELNIRYSDYQISAAGPGSAPTTADGNPTLPDPASLTVEPH